MESEDATPEKLVEGLKLAEDQSYPSQTKFDNVHTPRVSERDIPPVDLEARGDNDLFHDCNDSFKSEVTEENHNCEVDSSENQTDIDEKYLLELEKDMSEEEKQKRRNESITLKEEGNVQFKNKEYEEAEDSYAKALKVCPACYSTDRSVLYSNRAAARMKQDKKEAAIGDCSKALELNPDYIKALLRRAELYEKTEKLDEALEDYKNLLEKDPSIHPAREACLVSLCLMRFFSCTVSLKKF
ncbi:tetratricopeptide repeat protein 1 isoform X2 [Sphaerodactylus townsendi]|uniref:tetratricopeptide repeat protein 1 isoform X2 n=1 Tax=Sphaerodactylus townsendi TaxID=933632 RepID=UPI002027016C|nr:tetratricopeptide repeat protein 1 isoform X2 [Sphaerodactylus townsendi]